MHFVQVRRRRQPAGCGGDRMPWLFRRRPPNPLPLTFVFSRKKPDPEGCRKDRTGRHGLGLRSLDLLLDGSLNDMHGFPQSKPYVCIAGSSEASTLVIKNSDMHDEFGLMEVAHLPHNYNNYHVFQQWRLRWVPQTVASAAARSPPAAFPLAQSRSWRV
jgi:hypothetical protein